MNMASRKKKESLSLGLNAINHISRNCASVQDSIDFYCNVLDFVEIKRPRSFDFDGAWLFNYGIGIHLLKDEAAGMEDMHEREINSRADHISFQCEDMGKAERGLQARKLKYIRQVVTEGGILVDQLFFHDPDGHMIEICNCQLLPVEPLSCPRACAISCSPSPCCIPAHPSPAVARSCSPRRSQNILSEATKLSARLGMSASRFGNVQGAGTALIQPLRRAAHGSSWNLEQQALVSPAFDGSVWKSDVGYDLEVVDHATSFNEETERAFADMERGVVSEFLKLQHGYSSDKLSQVQDVKRKRDKTAPCA